MNTQSEQAKQSAYQLAVVSVILGGISIAPWVLAFLSAALAGIFHIQWLSDFHAWIGPWIARTGFFFYIGLLGLPGLIIGIIARIRALTKKEKERAVLGIILGTLGLGWNYLIWSFVQPGGLFSY
jgi:hypothetical protein